MEDCFSRFILTVENKIFIYIIVFLSTFRVHASLVQKSETNEAVSFWGRILSFVNNLLLENGNRELKRLHKCDQYLTEMVTVLEAFFLMDQVRVSKVAM